jgi:hypothetical protein
MQAGRQLGREARKQVDRQDGQYRNAGRTCELFAMIFVVQLLRISTCVIIQCRGMI